MLADATADPELVAADLISQAEHDELAAAVLVTDSAELAAAVEAAVTRRAATTANADRVHVALQGEQSAIVLVDSIDAAVVGQQRLRARAPRGADRRRGARSSPG